MPSGMSGAVSVAITVIDRRRNCWSTPAESGSRTGQRSRWRAENLARKPSLPLLLRTGEVERAGGRVEVGRGVEHAGRVHAAVVGHGDALRDVVDASRRVAMLNPAAPAQRKLPDESRRATKAASVPVLVSVNGRPGLKTAVPWTRR